MVSPSAASRWTSTTSTAWPLEAETLEEALAEAASRSFDWSGFGHRTLGNVTYVCALGEDLHLFQCDDTTPEQ